MANRVSEGGVKCGGESYNDQNPRLHLKSTPIGRLPEEPSMLLRVNSEAFNKLFPPTASRLSITSVEVGSSSSDDDSYSSDDEKIDVRVFDHRSKARALQLGSLRNSHRNTTVRPFRRANPRSVSRTPLYRSVLVNVTSRNFQHYIIELINGLAEREFGLLRKREVPEVLSKLNKIHADVRHALLSVHPSQKKATIRVKKTAATLFNHIGHSQTQNKRNRGNLYIRKSTLDLVKALLSGARSVNICQLGGGAHGTVSKHRIGSKAYAIKTSHKGASANKCLRKEAVVSARIPSHGNILSVILYDPDHNYAVLPLMKEDLVALLKRNSLTYEMVMGYIKQLLSAIEFAHTNGIVFRDIKPHNILVSADGKIVKICDLGIAEMLSKNLMRTSGTILYSAPESLVSSPPKRASDMWSLGATIWQMLTGEAFNLTLYYSNFKEGAELSHLAESPPNVTDIGLNLMRISANPLKFQPVIEATIDTLGTSMRPLNLEDASSMALDHLNNLKVLLRCLLQATPSLRITAANALKSVATG